MIKFFRKIRQNLLLKNQTSKYFKYAIGEIVLVVIGILIALQINNWNEDRKERIQEQTLLKNLLKDLNESYQIGHDLIKRDSLQVKYLIDFIGPKKVRDSLLRLQDAQYKIMRGLWSVETQIPVIQSFEDMKNSGNSVAISNQEVRKKLTYLDKQIETIQFQNEDRMYIQRTYIDPLIFDDLDYKSYSLSISNKNTEYKTNTDFEYFLLEKGIQNKLTAKMQVGLRTLKMREDLQKQIQDLISIIKNEINDQ